MSVSPNKKWLAVGSHDKRIYLYETNEWKLMGTCEGHKGSLTAIDWSTDSNYLRSNCNKQ